MSSSRDQSQAASGAREPIDTAKIKVGDEVLIRATLANKASPDNWGFHFEHTTAGKATHYAKPSTIVSFEPRSLEAGDHVWGLSTKCNGTVRATYQNLAWVEFEDGRHEVCFPHQVERHQ